MTRRKFIEKLAKTGVLALSGLGWLADRANPRRFVRAIAAGKYPGSVGPLSDISKQGKWSG